MQAEGGGLYLTSFSFPFVELYGVQISGNLAEVNSLIANSFARGGGIHAAGIELEIEDSTLSANQAVGLGTALGVGGGLFSGPNSNDRGPGFPGDVELDFGTVVENGASHIGGGLSGSIEVYSSIVLNNSVDPSNSPSAGPNCDPMW